MNNDNFMATVVLSFVAVIFLVIFGLGITRMHYKDNETMGKLGYEQRTVLGATGTHWQKIEEAAE